MRRLCILAALTLAASPIALTAQEAASGTDANALAQAAANPIANMISLPFQLNDDLGYGPYDRSQKVLNIQPVLPLAGGKIVTRTIFPIVWIPEFGEESGQRTSGLSDINATAFYVPKSGSFMWGVGPVVVFPTGGSERGTEKWSAGPSAVVLSVNGPWTLGVLANNVWSFAGDDDRADVNQGLLQYFLVYQLGDGWYVNSSPIITVDWEAEEDKWRVPFGGGGGKVLTIGKLPVNLQAGAYWYAVKPDFGPDWQLRFQAQLLFPM